MILVSKIGIIWAFLLSALFLIGASFVAAQDTTSNKSTASTDDVIITSSVTPSKLTSISKSTNTVKLTSDSKPEISETKQNVHQSIDISKPKAKTTLSKLTMGLLTAAKKSIEKGEYEVAEEAYRQTLLQADISGNHKRVQKVSLQLARLLKRTKQFEEALAIYSRLNLKANKPEVHLEYIRLLHDSGANEKALENCKILLENHPKFIKAELTAGMITKSNGDFMSALLHFDRYLAMHPKDPLALLETGNLLEKMKQWKQAKMLYDKLLELQPDNRQALRNRGNTLVHMEKYELAVKDLTASGMQAIPWVERLLRYAKGQLDIAKARSSKQKIKVVKTKPKDTKSKINLEIETTAVETELKPVSSKQTSPEPEAEKQIIAKLNEIDFIEFSPVDNQIDQKKDIEEKIISRTVDDRDSEEDASLSTAAIDSKNLVKIDNSTNVNKTSQNAQKERYKLDEISEGSGQIETNARTIQIGQCGNPIINFPI